MREAITGVIINFKSFIGSGWLMWGVYCAAVILCFFLKGKRRKKLFTVSLVGCVLILNPVVYELVGTRFMSGVYWRLFWALPIVPVVAVVLTELVGRVKRNALRFAATIILCLAIAVFGKSVINRDTYGIPQNDYQIPQAAIDVADILLKVSEQDFSTAIVPNELFCYIRQYSSDVRLTYGRNIWGFINVPTDGQRELYDLMNAQIIDYQLLRDKAYDYNCKFIVFNSDHRDIPESMEDYGYYYVDEVHPYIVYALQVD